MKKSKRHLVWSSGLMFYCIGYEDGTNIEEGAGEGEAVDG